MVIHSILHACTQTVATYCISGLQVHLPSQDLIIFVINDSGNHWTLLVRTLIDTYTCVLVVRLHRHAASLSLNLCIH